jgi:dCTP deaminase
MFLSDHDIIEAVATGALEITPFDPEAVQPASVDLTLDDKLLVFHHDTVRIDPREEVQMKSLPKRFRNAPPEFILKPFQFALAATREKVSLGPGLVGRLEGKSSLGRLGLTSHVTAGFFDPGFSGYATLELFNASGKPFVLIPGMKICQMSFALTVTPSVNPYGSDKLTSKYQNQERGPKGSQYHKNFESK